MPRRRCVCGEMVCASGCRVWARAGVVAPVAQPGKNTPGAQAHGQKGEARQRHAPPPCKGCCAWGAEAFIGWRTRGGGCCWLLLLLGRFDGAEFVQSRVTRSEAKVHRLAWPGGVCGQAKGERVRGGWVVVCACGSGCLCCASTAPGGEGFHFRRSTGGWWTGSCGAKSGAPRLEHTTSTHTMHRRAFRRSAWAVVGLVSVLDDHPPP